jgi:dihydroorotate dehydrogenase electron transfer subunit
MISAGQRPSLEAVRVVANDRIAQGVGLAVLHAPRVAAAVSAGQFIHLRVAQGSDIILRRPFSVHRAYADRIEILYQILGSGTLRLAEKVPGDEMDALGPLGHGWQLPDGMTHALLVAGGLGAAPLGMLAEKLAQRGIAVAIAHGAPTQERLVGRELFERTARRIEFATDDGSVGERGFVVEPARRLLAEERFDQVYACGPEQMQQRVAELAAAAGVSCQVSLERLMACGIGACLSCVVSTTSGLKRACVDGPVFDAEEVTWDVSERAPKH